MRGNVDAAQRADGFGGRPPGPARLPVATLKRVFAGFLFVLAAKMVHSAWAA